MVTLASVIEAATIKIVSNTHIMVEKILNQWSGGNFCDLHLTIII